MTKCPEVEVLPRDLEPLRRSSARNVERAARALARGRGLLAGRALWNINSTARGGGVAELLVSLIAFARSAGIDARWATISGDEPFFHVTKRLHHALHGASGDGSELGDAARECYDRVIRRNVSALLQCVRSGDVVVLHDPQTAGLAPHFARHGVTVIWRCHIGQDETSAESMRGWSFLAPYLRDVDGFVFSRAAYIPAVVPRNRCVVIPPSIDPLSVKNQDMVSSNVRAILAACRLLALDVEASGAFVRGDGSTGVVGRAAQLDSVGGPPAPEVPLVVQVSRWDPLKDPVGVMNGFVRMLEDGRGGTAELMLVGPSVEGVTDDPEGAATLEEVRAHWRALAEPLRRRIHLATLPMQDIEENAAMVNAIQRHAAVVVQKSLREGFGLTVTEAMWKGRPVLASRVGGIQDQIEHDQSGVLIDRPGDIDEFAARLAGILEDPQRAERLGRGARQRVLEHFLADRHLEEYANLIAQHTHGGEGSKPRTIDGTA